MTDTPRTRVEALRASDTAFQAAGLSVREVSDGQVAIDLTIRPEMTNGAGIAHGGWIFLLADTALGYAATTRRPGALTSDADIRFHRPARLGDTLTARATIVHESGSSLVVDVVVLDSAGERIASLRGGGRVPRTPAAPDQK